MLNSPIRLDDLLARDLKVQWFESVALVQSVCRELAAAGQEDGFPLPAAIALGPDGRVTIKGFSPSSDAAPNAARLLSGMVSDDFPVQLRLVVSQAGDGTFETLGAFSSALAYYERPDPQQILAALHQRASHAPRKETGGFAAEEEVQTPAFQAGSTHVPSGRGERWPLAAAGVVCAVIVAFIGVMEFGSGNTHVDAAIDNFKGTLSNKLGVVLADSPIEPLEKETAKPPSGGGPSQARAATRRDGRTANRMGTGTSAAAAMSPLPLLDPLHERGTLVITPRLRPSNAFYESIEVAASAALDGGNGRRIYSAADTRVVPPRAVYPQLPVPPPAGTWLGDHTVIELVISPDGIVERVRMTTAPRNVHEFMLMSAAKAWRFDAALGEDGRPVRFRHRVVLPLP